MSGNSGIGKTELTVGIIGGMGPYATLAFIQNILANTPAQKDWDHLRTIIDNNPKIPSRTRAFLFNEESPVAMIAQSANGLKEAGADFVVLPCNSAHYFLPSVRKYTNIEFLDMIDAACDEIEVQGARRVGIIGGEVTVKAGLYEQRLGPRGISVLQVSDNEQGIVREIIEDGKLNSVTDRTREKLQSILESLKKNGADTIVLACTELPMVMPGIPVNCGIVDSLDVLAKAVVLKAKNGRRNDTPMANGHGT